MARTMSTALKGFIDKVVGTGGAVKILAQLACALLVATITSALSYNRRFNN